MNGQADRLQALHEELASLKSERSRLREELERQRRENDKNKDLLDDLARGVLPGAKKKLTIFFLAIGLLVGVAAVVLYSKLWDDDKSVPPTPRILQRKLVPHLMITSEPAGATVSIGGRAVGSTPLVVRAPTQRGEVLVDVEASGYRPVRKALPVSYAGGAQWHVLLDKRTE